MEQEKINMIEELGKGIFLVFGDTEICIRLKFKEIDAYIPLEEQIEVKIGGRKIKYVKPEDFKKLQEVAEKVYKMLQEFKSV